jgi:branched-chain amino acid transport system substrate-binding protein
VRHRRLFAGCLAGAIAGLGALLGAGGAAGQSAADNTVKIGFVIPMTGPSAAVGREISGAAQLYMARHGDAFAGKKIEFTVKDDAGAADNAKRLAQDLIDTDKVNFLGVGLTPSAIAMAPLATQAKIPTLVMASAASSVTAASPFYVRTSYTLGQESGVIADWAIKTGSKKAVMILSDGALATEAGKVFEQNFSKGDGEVLDTLNVPTAGPDFSPVLQRAREMQPDTLFVCVPAAQAATLARQFSKQGLDKMGIRLVGPGDIADDDDLAATGDALLGVVTAGSYSAVHPSQFNKDYAAAYEKASGRRANAISVAAYDGIDLIYQALQKTGGNTGGDALIGAMKGMAWESPRGPISIDPQTRDIVQNIYIRKVEMVNGEPWAIEFKTFPAVKDTPSAATTK